MEKEKTNLADNLIKEFEDKINSGNGNEITGLRKEAIDYFRQKGFPTRKDEEWHYTNISPLLKRNYILQTGGEELKKKDINQDYG